MLLRDMEVQELLKALWRARSGRHGVCVRRWCVCAGIYARMHVDMYVHMRMYTDLHSHTSIRKYVYIYIHTYIPTYY